MPFHLAVFKTDSQVGQAGCQLAIEFRISLNSSSFFLVPSSGSIASHHQAPGSRCFEFEIPMGQTEETWWKVNCLGEGL